MLRIPKISRTYLRHAAAYRRYAGDVPFDFSVAALIACYRHETFGEPAAKRNGFIYGKWVRDISVVQWIEDIRRGDACKHEFYTPKDKWWARPALENIVPGTFFPYSSELDINNTLFRSSKKGT